MKRRMAAVAVESPSIIDITKHCLQINIQAKLNHFILAQYIFPTSYNLHNQKDSQYLVSS